MTAPINTFSRTLWRSLLAIAACGVIAGCTAHPPGEGRERDLARVEGARYALPANDRPQRSLPDNPTPDDLVAFAAVNSPELEQRYWEWESAIEQIPQDGTQPTNLVLYGNLPVTHGSTAFNRTTITLANDPMADLQWPAKPTTAARRALEAARAAGYRFQQAKLDLRQKVLNAYYDYALTAELARLGREESQLLNTAAIVAEGGIATGRSTQSEALCAHNDAEMAGNSVDELAASLPGERAALNAAIGRDPAQPLAAPSKLPSPPDTADDTAALLQQVAAHSPDLAALAADVRAKQQSVHLAKLQFVPDFSFSAGTDLAADAQSLMGMVTVPMLRHEAIQAAIAQADANLRAAESSERKSEYDLRSRLLADFALIDDAHRQIKWLAETLLPRSEQIVQAQQAEYEQGRAAMATLLESERTVTTLKRLRAKLQVARAQRIIDVETLTATAASPAAHPGLRPTAF